MAVLVGRGGLSLPKSAAGTVSQDRTFCRGGSASDDKPKIRNFNLKLDPQNDADKVQVGKQHPILNEDVTALEIIDGIPNGQPRCRGVEFDLMVRIAKPARQFLSVPGQLATQQFRHPGHISEVAPLNLSQMDVF
jgi:hypothetical protein